MFTALSLVKLRPVKLWTYASMRALIYPYHSILPMPHSQINKTVCSPVINVHSITADKPVSDDVIPDVRRIQQHVRTSTAPTVNQSDSRL